MSYQVNKGPKHLEALSRSKQFQPEKNLPAENSFSKPDLERQNQQQAQEEQNQQEQSQGTPSQQEQNSQQPAPSALDILLQQAGVMPEDGNLPQANPDLELGTGFLAVNVTTGRGLLPIEGAVVTITTQQTLGQLVWARGITNSSGQIPPVALPAPPKLLSQYPETPQQLAYGLYNVYAQARNMIPNLRQNVEVFDGVTSIQNIDLTPSGAAMPEESLNGIDEIPMNAL